jgi:hypothetical protein
MSSPKWRPYLFSNVDGQIDRQVYGSNFEVAKTCLRPQADGEVIVLAATKRTSRWTHLNCSIQSPYVHSALTQGDFDPKRNQSCCAGLHGANKI